MATLLKLGGCIHVYCSFSFFYGKLINFGKWWFIYSNVIVSYAYDYFPEMNNLHDLLLTIVQGAVDIPDPQVSVKVQSQGIVNS